MPDPQPMGQSGATWGPDTAVRALWECLLLSGADVSDYAYETRTAEGREVGFQGWMRHGTAAEVVAAVADLRRDYDDAPVPSVGTVPEPTPEGQR